MNLRINGERQSVEKDPVTVTELLQINKIKSPDMVSVQLNGVFVDREVFTETQLRTDDEIDFLYFMGGGSS